MQEEYLMEKSKNRPLQPYVKGPNNDKKSQDASSAKVYSRGGRRREPSGSSFSSKNDLSRKPLPQRNSNRMVDKRPRPRGYYHSGTLDGNTSSRVVDEEIEFGSILVPGSKKQNLNHLLNFHFEPRDTHWRSGSGGMPYKVGGRLVSTYKHKYNKEQFLQANCQFIVKAGADYKLHMNNPDSLVNWDLIEQVNINVIEYPSCPICLYPPKAAKMTRCGHIYCWSCLLHYLALTDKTWRKCPICFESVHKKDLKTVMPVPHLNFNTSEEITFNLMKKLRGSLNVCPIEEVCNEDILPNVSQLGSARLYSKILIADKADVINIIMRERNELELQLHEDENCPEKCFIEQALQLLEEREKLVFKEFDLELTNLKISDNVANNECEYERNVKELEVGSKNCTGIEETNLKLIEDQENIAIEDLEISSYNAQKTPKYFYFYQASDGQHIYMHSLNIKMLEHTYGTLENCPKTVIGRIVEKESGSMTEDLRKRLRYLQHLPISCPFEVAEIQLLPPAVALNTVTHFHEQIELRRKRRHHREKEEKRRAKRIEEQENMKMGRFRSANIHIESHRQFPDFGLDQQGEYSQMNGQISPYSERSLSPSTLLNSSTNTPLSGSLNKEGETGGLSFAKMLSSSKPRTTSESDSMKSVPSISASNTVKMINVTGSQARSSFAKKSNRKNSDSEPEPDEYVPVPAFNRSFGDAIASALEKAALTNDIDNNGGSQQQRGKKKKKGKQKVLFATSMTFSGN